VLGIIENNPVNTGAISDGKTKLEEKTN